jgi:hypothetical protein
MAGETRQNEFKPRFVAVVAHARKTLPEDTEAFEALGTLAHQIVMTAKKRTWSAFRASLTQTAFTAILARLQQGGTELAAKGEVKKAYAVQLLASALIAGTHDDADIQAGARLVDGLIDRALAHVRAEAVRQLARTATRQ